MRLLVRISPLHGGGFATHIADESGHPLCGRALNLALWALLDQAQIGTRMMCQDCMRVAGLTTKLRPEQAEACS